jgi:hypothetical protein
VRRDGRAWIAVLVLATTLGSTTLPAQVAGDPANHRFVDFTVGMGIGLHSAVSVANYINLKAQPRLDEKVSDFSSAVEFYAVPEIQLSQN